MYFLLDTGPVSQKVQDLVVKYFATLRVIERLSDQASAVWEKALQTADDTVPCAMLGVLDTGLGEIGDTLNLFTGAIASGVESLVVDGLGVNLLSIFQSPRQRGDAPTNWYWADHLHYHKVDVFSQNLLDLAFLSPTYKDSHELRAYALGYFSHVIGDVVGHPYVNQIVGGPYRLHRWRHTLVENFIDGYVWSRTHEPYEGPDTISGDKNPATGRPWLDRVRSASDCGAQSESAYYRSRIDTFIDIGSGDGFLPGLEAALDHLADATEWAADKVLGTHITKVGDDELFQRWLQLLLEALHKTFDGDLTHPKRLAGDGFPTAQNLASAYATCLALLRMQTSSAIEEPTLPDLGNISDAAKKWWNDLKEGLKDALDKIQSPHLGGHFSFSALWDFVKSVVEAAVALCDALLQSLKDICKIAGAVAKDIVELAFFWMKKALWAMYTAFHQALEMHAYAQPLPDTINEHPDLWRHRQNAEATRPGYPIMEERGDSRPMGSPPPLFTKIEGDQLSTALEPAADPRNDGGRNFEFPPVAIVGQDFQPTGGGEFVEPATPMALLFAPADLGETGMFGGSGPMPFNADATVPPRKYGGIVPNCQHALEAILAQSAKPGATTVIPPSLTLHDYNLDGDRGIGWLNWRLQPASGPTPASPPLRPDADIDTHLVVQPWSA